MPSLILIKSPGGMAPTKAYPLDPQNARVVIGRQKEACDIVIDDGKQSVSRQHAVVSGGGEQYWVEDTSRNGSLLNNKPVAGRTPLKSEDRIKICDFLFRFVDERVAKPAPLPSNFLSALPDPEAESSPGEMTTVQHTVSRNAAQQFLDNQPTERLRVLLDISTSLSRTLELEPLLPQIVDALFGVFRQADRCFVIQMDAGGRAFAKAMRTRRPGSDDRFSRTIVRRCLESGQSYLSEDASADQALGAAQSIAEFRIRSVMCVPLLTADGKPLGAIQLDTQDVGKKFREDDLKMLTIVANLASVAVEKAQVVAALLVREKALREIELAKQVQLGFLPQKAPTVPGYEFYGYYSAAQTVGGDYYDYIPLPGGRLAVVLGDVAGKGVPAAMLMAKLSAEVRYCFLTETDPGKALAKLNDQLYRGGIGDRFVTLAAMVLDPAAHCVTLVNAGHQTPLRWGVTTAALTAPVTDDHVGLPLGVMEGYEYGVERLDLAPGDVLAVFTDGVTDAANPGGVLFELDGIHTAMRADPRLAATSRPRAIGERLVSAVKAHVSGHPQSDDIALVCFGRVSGPDPAASGPPAHVQSA